MVFHSAPFLYVPFGFLPMVLVVETIGYVDIKLARTEVQPRRNVTLTRRLKRFADDIDEETYETRAHTLREQ